MSIVERALQKAAALGRTQASEAAQQQQRPGARRPAGNGAAAKAASSPNAQHLEIRFEDLRTAGLVSPVNMEHRIAEEFRLIKRPLLLNAEKETIQGNDSNLVMVASALPGAGKTFISFNLAVSMASELDWTVLLVDADVTRPTLSRKLGLGHAPGLVDLLERDGADLADFAYSTSLPGLQVLPAGSSRSNVKELLTSQRMRSLVADLVDNHHHRIVLFDSPPLLLTSEARVLASYVGQIVVAVEAGITPRQSLLDALETLDHSKAINLVLNKNWQPLAIGEYHYAGYGSYGRDREEKAEG